MRYDDQPLAAGMTANLHVVRGTRDLLCTEARHSQLDRLQLAVGEPHHLQQQPAVAEARDLGFAEGARLVVDRRLDNFQVLLCRAKDQIEIAERIEIAEIPRSRASTS